MKPICVNCQCFYRPKRNGFAFTQMMQADGVTTPVEERRGTRAPEAWQPYKIWMGDLWQCPDCAHELIVGTGYKPLAERYEDKFAEMMTSHGADRLKVNDC